MSGHAWLVGAGPGDPGLCTVAGIEALERADVVLYDALAAPALLRKAAPGAELINVGKRAGHHALSQAEIEALLVERAKAGNRVVRLKGGDPFVFGRGGEEALACRRANIPFTIVPGVTSAIAAPAFAGIPVTQRGVAPGFTVITGNTREDGSSGREVDWDAAARSGTLVILMGAESLRANMVRLMAAGMAANTPAAAIRWGTRPEQRSVHGTIGTLPVLAEEARLGSPMVTVVGEVARLADEIAWFEPGPLAGRRIVVTRARTQASELAEMLEARGAETIEAPVLDIVYRPDDLVTDERVSSRWDWIMFTSANGVEAFFRALADAGRDARALSTTQIAAIGDATAAALLGRGIRADFIPSKATSTALAEEAPRVQGARILLPVSTLTDSTLAQALRSRGALVEQVSVYATQPLPLDDETREAVLASDAITFASASSARNLHRSLAGAEIGGAVKLISIGARTSDAVRESFGRVDHEAKSPALDALVSAIEECLAWD